MNTGSDNPIRKTLPDVVGELRADIDLLQNLYLTREQRAALDRVVAASLATPTGGAALIAAERQRHQLHPKDGGEGWTKQHDQQEHDMGELACAAACYATPPRERIMLLTRGTPDLWPWDATWWKPGDRIRELTKAGALCAAEIDRLQGIDAEEARHEAR